MKLSKRTLYWISDRDKSCASECDRLCEPSHLQGTSEPSRGTQKRPGGIKQSLLRWTDYARQTYVVIIHLAMSAHNPGRHLFNAVRGFIASDISHKLIFRMQLEYSADYGRSLEPSKSANNLSRRVCESSSVSSRVMPASIRA